MSLHRFFVPLEISRAERFRLEGPEAHHALHVLRVRQGEEVSALDGAGAVLHCVIAEAGKRDCVLRVERRELASPPKCKLTLFQAIPKGKTFEVIIQKATELGVTRIVPLITKRVMARPEEKEFGKKSEKWQNIAIEAVKQCGQPWLPQVEAPAELEEALRERDQQEIELVGALSNAARHPRSWFDEFRQSRGRAPLSAAVWIGPEGDFSLDELDAIIRAGTRPISLGPLVLRCDTAAMYSLSVVQHEVSS